MTPDHPNKRLRSRQAMILSRMRRWGYLAEQQVLTAAKPEVAAPATEATATTDTDLTAAPAETETTNTTATTSTTDTAPLPATTTT